ncbi:MAG: Gfo/Idh/MocA family oxidoreductase [Candidatus Omnitrophota bacterium]
MMIGVGIIGLGKSGLEIHVPCLEAIPEFRIAAGCDATEARRTLAQQRVSGMRAYANLEDFLADESVQLVVVTTPTASHEAIALQTLEAGKDLLVDKPLALDLAGTDRIIQSAQEKGRLLTMFQNRRWEPGFACLQKLLADSVIGKVLGIESRRMKLDSTLNYPAQEFRPTWRQEKQFGGGVIYDCVPHDLDQLLLLAPGAIECVYAETKTALWSQEVETAYFASLTYSDGLNIKAETSRISPHSFPRWYAIGEEGSIVIESDKGPAVVRRTRLFKTGVREIAECEHPVPHPILPEGILFYQNLAEYMRQREPLMVPPAHIRRVMAVMQAIRESAEGRRVVVVDGEGKE